MTKAISLIFIFLSVNAFAQFSLEGQFSATYDVPNYKGGIQWKNNTLTLELDCVMYSEDGQNSFETMIQHFWDEGIKGAGNIYTINPLTQPEFSAPLSANEFNVIVGEVIDTSYTENLETGEYVPVIQTLMARTVKDISGIRLYQRWYYDEKNTLLEAEVYAVGFLIDIHDENGILRGHVPLFIAGLGDADAFPLIGKNRGAYEYGSEQYKNMKSLRSSDCTWAQEITIDFPIMGKGVQHFETEPTKGGYRPTFQRQGKSSLELKRTFDKELVSYYYEAAKTGTKMTWNQDDLSKPLAKGQFSDVEYVVDTSYVEDLATGEYIPVVQNAERFSNYLKGLPSMFKVDYSLNYNSKKHSFEMVINRIGIGDLKVKFNQETFFRDSGGVLIWVEN